MGAKVVETQLTKFHGIYQQDDRDIRDECQAQGVEPAYSFMIRVRMPGGVCDPQQWLLMDQISDEHGTGRSRSPPGKLKPAIQDINRALLDTLAACRDVNRLVPLARSIWPFVYLILLPGMYSVRPLQHVQSYTLKSSSSQRPSANI